MKSNWKIWNWKISPAPVCSQRLKFNRIRAIGNPVSFLLFGELQLLFPSKKTVFRVWNMPVFDVFACRWSLLLRHALVYFEGKNAVSVWWRFVKSGFLSPSSSFSRVKMPFFAANLSEREPIRESVGCMSATFMLFLRSVGT